MTVKLIFSVVAGAISGWLFGQLFTGGVTHMLATFFVATPLGAAALLAGIPGAIAAAITSCIAVKYLYDPVYLAAFIGVHAIPIVFCSFAFFAGSRKTTRLTGSSLGRAVAILGVCFALTAGITYEQLNVRAEDLAATGALSQSRPTLAQSYVYEIASRHIEQLSSVLQGDPNREKIIDGHFRLIEAFMPWFLGFGVMIALSHFVLGAWAGMSAIVRFGKPARRVCKADDFVLPAPAAYMALPFIGVAMFTSDAQTAFLMNNVGLVLAVPVVIYGLVIAHVLSRCVRYPKLSLTVFYVVTFFMEFWGLVIIAALGIIEDNFNLRAKHLKRET